MGANYQKNAYFWRYSLGGFRICYLPSTSQSRQVVSTNIIILHVPKEGIFTGVFLDMEILPAVIIQGNAVHVVVVIIGNAQLQSP